MDNNQKKRKLYIPLSQQRVQQLASCHEQSLEKLLGELSVAEVSAVALLIIASHQQDTTKIYPLERTLANLIEKGSALELEHPGRFAKEIHSRFCITKINRALEKNISLIDEDEIAQSDYLAQDGSWDYTFQDRYKKSKSTLKYRDILSDKTTTRDQSQILREIIAQPDESMHLQALAGTGKTHLIELIFEELGKLRFFKPLILAQNSNQLVFIKKRLGYNFNSKTIAALAKWLMDQDLTNHWYRSNKRYKPSYNISDEKIAEILGFSSVGGLPPRDVAKICRQALKRFCDSNEPYLTENHLRYLPTLNYLDISVLVEYARLLWKNTIHPEDSSISLPLRAYHRIKYITLNPYEFNRSLKSSHIIIDESHNLSVSEQQFIDSFGLPVLTLGDNLQNLQGAYYPRKEMVRKRHMYQSVRSGKPIEEIVNPVIQAHPYAPAEVLQGSPEMSTRVEYYDGFYIPNEECTLLTFDEWGLFECFQRLAMDDNAKNNFRFITSGAESNFRKFALSCIYFFHSGVPSSHYKLSQYKSWNNLSKAHEGRNNKSFERVQAILESGYSHTQLIESLDKIKHNGKAKYLIGMINDSRNMETKTVMLTRDALHQFNPIKKTDTARYFSMIYTGETRGKHKIYLPGDLQGWLQDSINRVKTASRAK